MGEQQSLAELHRILQGIQLQDESDRLIWADGSDIFAVKLCYQKILSLHLNFFSKGLVHYNWEAVWGPKVPSKVGFLVWLIVRKKVLMQQNLQRRGYRLASKCVLCNRDIEDSKHLFISCEVVSAVWHYFCNTVSLRSLLLDYFGDRLCNWKPVSKMRYCSLAHSSSCYLLGNLERT